MEYREIDSRYKRKPGDRVVRVARPVHETVRIRSPKVRGRGPKPAVVFLAGFAALIVLGTILLSLPAASRDGERTTLIDALFTATSAVCVTGLVVVDTATHWTPFGQVVILGLIQLGGFGFMTSSIALLLLVGRRPRLRDRMLVGESMGAGALGGTLGLVRRVAVVTLVIELIGALVLFLSFSEHTSLDTASWWGVFHSVSAFNNAGFDVQGEFRSLTAYRRDWLVLVPITGLIVLGGISYTVLADIAGRRSWRRLSVDTKLTVSTYGGLLVLGAAALLAMEASNPSTLGPLSWTDKVLNASFHSVTARTAGFNSLPMPEMHEQSLFSTMALMFIGGASGSTAGGIKVQTFSLLFFAILASIRGSEYVVAFGREIPQGLVYRALSVALLAVAIVFGVALILTITEPFGFTDVFFEAVSAFGTVGLSTGITPELSIWGRLVLIATMFVGRLGPLTLVLALAARAARPSYRYAPDTCKIG